MGRHAAPGSGFVTGARGLLTAVVRGALPGAAAGLVVLGLLVVAVSSGLLGGGSSGPSPEAESDGAGVVTAAVRPTSLTVPALDLSADVLPVEVDPDGVLDPPGDVADVGWWKRSAKIGASRGQTVLTGHSVHTGGGVMDELERLDEGDEVRVFHRGARQSYTVRAVRVWSKEKLARKAPAIFSQDRQRGRLVLITCEDWDGTAWESNVVVLADPVRA